jgi:hypothetical protein
MRLVRRTVEADPELRPTIRGRSNARKATRTSWPWLRVPDFSGTLLRLRIAGPIGGLKSCVASEQGRKIRGLLAAVLWGLVGGLLRKMWRLFKRGMEELS